MNCMFMRFCRSIFFLVFILVPSVMFGNSFVVGKMTGQLGNQMFVIAATVSLALENDAEPLFPDFLKIPPPDRDNLGLNYQMLFHRLNISKPSRNILYTYKEPFFHYQAIPYKRNMVIRGYFQSEKYFKKHKETVIDLFSPTTEIINYLTAKYLDVIEHPKTVSVHLRSYLRYDRHQQYHITLPPEYFEKAMAMFPEDTLFVIFSNDMGKCKKDFAHINRKMRFIEGESHIHDFFLMSLCKDHIISNSTYSWWAAYINRNPNKLVIAPPTWFGPRLSRNDTSDLLPDDWVILQY